MYLYWQFLFAQAHTDTKQQTLFCIRLVSWSEKMQRVEKRSFLLSLISIPHPFYKAVSHFTVLLCCSFMIICASLLPKHFRAVMTCGLPVMHNLNLIPNLSYIYIYIYIHTHTHTHIQTHRFIIFDIALLYLHNVFYKALRWCYALYWPLTLFFSMQVSPFSLGCWKTARMKLGLSRSVFPPAISPALATNSRMFKHININI